MRLLLTGATGLIGRELVDPLEAAGFEVYAITTQDARDANGYHWVHGSLFDDGFVKRTMQEVRPSHLLNLAWATTGDYLTSELNDKFLHAGQVLAREFVSSGGKRAVYAGTCFEYKFCNRPLKEDDALEPERNAYTHCKNALRLRAAEIFGRNGISFGYGRVFYAFGRQESKSRLTGMVLDKIGRGEQVIIKSGPLKKDYIYTKDIAAAFVALLSGGVEGVVNICTGRAISIRDFVLEIANRMGRPDLVVFDEDCTNQPPLVVGDNRRLLQEVCFRPAYSVRRAVSEIVACAGF